VNIKVDVHAYTNSLKSGDGHSLQFHAINILCFNADLCFLAAVSSINCTMAFGNARSGQKNTDIKILAKCFIKSLLMRYFVLKL